MMDISTIYETFTLPSKGLVYDKPFDPRVTLRSMTTAEEMKRLSYTETPYKAMSDIITDCMKEKLPISVYDLCLGDYQFLLHQLRIVTYGTDYKLTVTCPNCGQTTQAKVDLSSLKVLEADGDFRDEMLITLPKTGKRVKLRLQTPRLLDEINLRKEEKKRKSKNSSAEYGLVYTLTSLIESVDGVVLNPIDMETFVRSLPMRDVNFILSEGDKFNRKVGLDSEVIATCGQCGYDILTFFRIGQDFFEPSFD